MLDLWVLLAILAVGGKTAFYSLQKHLLEGESSLRLGYITSIYGLACVAPLAAWDIHQNGLTLSQTDFFLILGIGVIELISFAVYLKALDLTDLSIASPLKKTKPVGVALLEPVLLGTSLSLPVVGAAISAGVGGYAVLMNGTGLLAPLKRLTSKGPFLALVAAFLSALLSIGSRFGNTATSTYVFGTVIFGVMAIGYTAILTVNGTLPSIREHFRREYMAVGSLGAFRSVTVWLAYSLAAATAVTTVTQLTIVIDVLVGGTLLKEENMRQRLVGAALILGGVLAVILVV